MKKLSRSEMKNVVGGYKLINGCVWTYCPTWSYVQQQCLGGYVTVALESCADIPFADPNAPGDCVCMNPS